MNPNKAETCFCALDRHKTSLHWRAAGSTLSTPSDAHTHQASGAARAAAAAAARCPSARAAAAAAAARQGARCSPQPPAAAQTASARTARRGVGQRRRQPGGPASGHPRS